VNATPASRRGLARIFRLGYTRILMQSREVTWREAIFAAVAAAAACLVFYAPIRAAGMNLFQAVINDIGGYSSWMPPWNYAAKGYLRGLFPIWVDISDSPPNVYVWVSSYFNPILLWTIPFDFLKVADIYFLSRVWLMCITAYIFCRSGMGMSRSGAALAAVAFAFSGIAQKRFLTVEMGVPWIIPLLLLSVQKTLKSPRIGWAMLFAISVALSIYAGHPILAFYSFFMAGLWALFLLTQKSSTGGGAVTLILAGIISIFFSAPQFIPGLELMALGWNYHPAQPLQGGYLARGVYSLAFPWLTGTNKFNLITVMLAPYLGLIPLFLAVFGIVHIRKSGAQTSFFAAYFLAFLGLSFMLPIFSALGHIPPLDRIMNTVAAFPSISLACAITAGRALDLGRDNAPQAGRLVKWCGGGVVVTLVCGLYGRWLIGRLSGSPRTGFLMMHTKEACSALAGELIAGVLLFAAAGVCFHMMSRERKHFAALVVFLAFSGLFVNNLGWNHENPGYFEKIRRSRAVEYLKNNFEEGYTTVTQCDYMDPNMYMATGVKNFLVVLVLHPTRYVKLLAKLNGVDNPEKAGLSELRRISEKTFYISLPARWFNTPLSDLLGIRYDFVCRKPLPRSSGPVFCGDAAVYESPSALPDQFLSGRLELVGGEDEALERLIGLERGEEKTVILASGDSGVEVAALPPAFEGNAGSSEVMRRDWQEVEIAVDARRDCLLLFRRLYYPGWEARVDGVPTRIMRADYLWQAVRVPAGKHRVEFRYVPAGFGIALWGFIASVVCAAGVLIPLRRKK